MTDARSPDEQLPDWNAVGYDTTKRLRYVYAFYSQEHNRLKVGTVSRHDRLDKRLREVARAHAMPDLRMVAHVTIDGINSHELEGYEASMQTFLALSAGLPFGLAVDWLTVPPDSPVRTYDDAQWQGLLDRSLAAVVTWKTNPIEL